ncbi:hypothetical protein ABZW30_42755 [Kitasatospora sp. NPDC004669]|uniref:hypothetical protein n=1 Tax=Kitasatospora sp. NPDC004669 TaxID=3154555 RepID=UPI0033AEFAC1
MFIVAGAAVLNGWRVARYSDARLGGWGHVAMGAGFSLDGLPRIVGWPDAVVFFCAVGGLVFVVLGVVVGTRELKGRRKGA